MQKQPHNWLPHYLTAFGATGLIALAWWAGAFHAQRIRRLLGSYPLLHITGPAASGKTTLVSALATLGGSAPPMGSAGSSKSALLALIAPAINRPVVIEAEGEENPFDWNELRSCYAGSAVPVTVTCLPAQEISFQGALALVGHERGTPSPLVVELNLQRQDMSEAQRLAYQALNQIPEGRVTGLFEKVHAATGEVAYHLSHVPMVAGMLQEELPGLTSGSARNHVQLRVLLDLLNDLLPLPEETLLQAHSQVRDMASRHASQRPQA